VSRSGNYIFNKNINGKLSLVGNFEEYYKNDDDPWDQSSINSDIASYYNFSRARLVRILKSIKNNGNIMEVGCGLGIVSNIIKKSMEHKNIYGIDISETAIQKAILNYKNIKFSVGDISSTSFKFNKKMDVIILNQMLWYILEKLDITIDNIYGLLNNRGHLIISMAFLEQQSYGAEIINGFEGLLKYCKKNKRFELTLYDFDNSGTYPYNDGLVCLKKLK